MRKVLLLSVFAVPLLLFPQTPAPSITGVWKADLQKSNIPGPPNTKVTDYLSIIEEKQVVINRRTQEKGPEIDDTTGIWGGPHGEERVSLSFLVTGRSAVRPYQGVPTEFTASWQGNTLSVVGETAGRPQIISRTYEVSPDGQTLTVHTTTTANGRQQQSTVVMTKQPDSAGEPLRKPEELAETHFKNVKTNLKTLPASAFIDQMRYISWALGRDCQFCHVQDDFSSDQKEEKKTAREMIDMTGSINANNFHNRPQVQCFTCHEMHNRPLSYPQFADQIAAMQQQQQQNRPGANGAGAGQPGNPPPTPRPPQ